MKNRLYKLAGVAGLCLAGLFGSVHADDITFSSQIQKPVYFRLYYENGNGAAAVAGLSTFALGNSVAVKITRPVELSGNDRSVYMSYNLEFPDMLTQQELKVRTSKDVSSRWYKINIGKSLGFLTGPTYMISADSSGNLVSKESKAVVATTAPLVTPAAGAVQKVAVAADNITVALDKSIPNGQQIFYAFYYYYDTESTHVENGKTVKTPIKMLERVYMGQLNQYDSSTTIARPAQIPSRERRLYVTRNQAVLKTQIQDWGSAGKLLTLGSLGLAATDKDALDADAVRANIGTTLLGASTGPKFIIGQDSSGKLTIKESK